MTNATQITVPTAQYEDHDDCLAAAAADVATRMGLELRQADAQWDGGDGIVVTVPSAAVDAYVGAASWRWQHAPTRHDDCAMGGDLVAPDGTVIAACLISDGDLDVTSDGCGVTDEGRALGLSTDDIDWPDEAPAQS